MQSLPCLSIKHFCDNIILQVLFVLLHLYSKFNAFCFIIKEFRLHDLNVTVGTDGSNFGCFCGFFKGPGTSHQVVNMTCQETCRGRYVRLQIVSGREFLQLCEVEVYSICKWKTRLYDICCKNSLSTALRFTIYV